MTWIKKQPRTARLTKNERESEDRVRALRRQMYEDLRWATRNRQLQREHAGKLVVVHRRRVVLSGDDEDELVAGAEGQGHPR